MKGLRFFKRDSGGGLILASYHPRGCPTWHWSITLKRNAMSSNAPWRVYRDERRTHQWHDYYRLWGATALIISRQDYHLRTPLQTDDLPLKEPRG